VLSYNVPLGEIIPADQSCWHYFHIEIKTTDLVVAGHGTRWTNVVKEHSKLLKNMRSAHEEHFINVSDLYRDVGLLTSPGQNAPPGIPFYKLTQRLSV
jgi:hypothetical protein